MTISQVITLAIVVSIVLTVFALGLDARPKDMIWLFGRPRLLVRSILSLNVIMVLFAVAVVRVFHLAPAVKIAIVALALSPVPPFLPKKAHKVAGTGSYAIGLVVSASLCSIVLIPAWLELLGLHFGFEAHPALREIIPIVLTRILAPLAAGVLVHRFAPKFAERIARPTSILATVLLVASVLPVLFISRDAMWAMIGRSGVLIATVLFSVAGILVGHLLGGPDADNRTILALATSMRHPGIALAVAGLNFPGQKKAVLIVILFHLIVGTIVGIPYVKWRRRLHAELTAKQQA